MTIRARNSEEAKPPPDPFLIYSEERSFDRRAFLRRTFWRIMSMRVVVLSATEFFGFKHSHTDLRYTIARGSARRQKQSPVSRERNLTGTASSEIAKYKSVIEVTICVEPNHPGSAIARENTSVVLKRQRGEKFMQIHAGVECRIDGAICV